MVEGIRIIFARFCDTSLILISQFKKSPTPATDLVARWQSIHQLTGYSEVRQWISF